MPQLIIGIVFVLNQINNDEFTINNIIIWSSIITSLCSLIYFSPSNRKINDQSTSFGVYLCRFLEVTSRIILLVLLWRYFGSLCLSAIVFLELSYLTICALLSHNLLLIGNIFYIIIDVYGRKKSIFFILYRIISSYLFCGIIGLLTMSNVLSSININNLYPPIFSVFDIANYNSMKWKIDETYWFYLFVYCLSAQIIYQILLFCKYKENIKSIGQCSHFNQLLNNKCWAEIYELMKLGSNYKDFAKHNDVKYSTYFNICCFFI